MFQLSTFHVLMAGALLLFVTFALILIKRLQDPFRERRRMQQQASCQTSTCVSCKPHQVRYRDLVDKAR